MSSTQDTDQAEKGQPSTGVCSASDMNANNFAGGMAYPSQSEEQDPDTSPEKGVARGADQSFSPDYKAQAVSSECTGNGYNFENLEVESFTVNLKSLLQDFIQQTQTTMESLLCSVSEIEDSSVDVTEELQNAKENGVLRKSKLEEDRDKVHQAACRVLEVLDVNVTDMPQPQSGEEGGN